MTIKMVILIIITYDKKWVGVRVGVVLVLVLEEVHIACAFCVLCTTDEK